MALQSMTALASITLQEASATVSFSNIPQNCRDLILIINQQVPGNFGLGIRFNEDSGSNYPQIMMRNNNTSPSSAAETGVQFYGSWASQLTNTRYLSTFQVMDYSATNKHKTTILRNAYTDANNSAQVTETISGRWTSLSAVNTIVIFATNATGFSANSTFDLYGRIG